MFKSEELRTSTIYHRNISLLVCEVGQSLDQAVDLGGQPEKVVQLIVALEYRYLNL
jgi:hypothetical protein